MNTRSSDPDSSEPHPLEHAILRRAELLEAGRTGGLPSEASAELDRLTRRLGAGLSEQPHTLRRLNAGEDDDGLFRLASLEPVHPPDDPCDLSELHDRVAEDRRCFVLENPAVAGRPLTVVWVALSRALPTGLEELLDTDRQRIDSVDAKIAVFYSIWNVEPGLAGIPLGSSLLALATETLRRELPGLETYTTLSPILGFRKWLEIENPDKASLFDALLGSAPTATQQTAQELDDGVMRSTVDPLDDSEMLNECARYLCTVDDDGRPIESVARFHMRNGARMWRLLGGADRSGRGWDRSWGAMVNYRYSPEDLAANSQAFADGSLVVSKEILNRIGYV